MLSRNAYYKLKPFIPRSWQLKYRKVLVLLNRKKAGHVWPIDPDSGQAPMGWKGWPESKKFALVLTHDVETEKGHEKVMQLASIEKALGFRSLFNFVPERRPEKYEVSAELREWLSKNGFEVGVHDLNHDGNLYSSRELFTKRAKRINEYIKRWEAKGFRSGAMFHNLEWIGMLDIDYDASTFDTDPFEPQPDGVGTIFPFWVKRNNRGPYVELPYTLAQDFTLFILLGEKTIRLWKNKLDWIAQNNGMALLIVHPDYIIFPGDRPGKEKYPIGLYQQFLEYCLEKYRGEYWHALPRQLAEFMLRDYPNNDSLWNLSNSLTDKTPAGFRKKRSAP
jgi:hypothetical protein